MEGYGEEFKDLRFLQGLPAHALVYDCVYTPVVTKLVHAAAERGLRAETGLSMLVWQGLLADALFFKGIRSRQDILSEENSEAVFKKLEAELFERNHP
jgi:shikimate 5-dehydrogenase